MRLAAGAAASNPPPTLHRGVKCAANHPARAAAQHAALQSNTLPTAAAAFNVCMRDSGVGERKCPVYDNLQLIFCDIVHQPLYILIHAIGALLDWHRRSGRDRRQDSRKEREQETSRLNCSLVKPIHYRDGMRRIDVRSVSDTGSPHCISALPSRIGF